MRRAWSLFSLIVLGFAFSRATAGEQHGLKVPPGFTVSIIADEVLAHDTYAMTLDSKGRIVVTTRGAIKTLHDDDGDGKADRAALFAMTATGGMGLCFDGPDLMFCGDGWLSRYRDLDGDGKADGPPERLIPLAFAEHGGHAVRKGPDGFWYVIGGNDSGIGPGHATAERSPIKKPEAGCLLRLTPDGKRCEIVAQGFRNPYDFDFNAYGDLFTYDSDVERDVFLPWYTPTRLFHVGIGGHHGWRLNGFQRGWPRPSDDPGTIPVLADIGRGSPTGVVCYRHSQFPSAYRGGLFVLDWTFGKVYFASLAPDGSSYKATVEVFLEPIGSSGFAPTDAVVAPDGSLLISIGGRKTRGSVYRITYQGPKEPEADKPVDDLAVVLRAPQPLDAWSRARWEPIADRLGAAAFLAAAKEKSRPSPERVRAIEIVTERFGGLTDRVAAALSFAEDLDVRARLTWSQGRVPTKQGWDIYGRTVDQLPTRLAMLESLWDRPAEIEPTTWGMIVSRKLNDTDQRVRIAVARLAVRLSKDVWTPTKTDRGWTDEGWLTINLAQMYRDAERLIHPEVASSLVTILERNKDAATRFQAIRLLMRALGDYHLISPATEVETGYSLQGDLSDRKELVASVLRAVRPILPSGNERLDEEAARLLGMLEDDDPATLAKVAAFFNELTPPTRDLHFLIVVARLKAPRDHDLTRKVARAVVSLDWKLKGQEQRIKQSWNARLTELVALLQKKDRALPAALLEEPRFVTSNHVAIALGLPPPERKIAARRYLDATKADPEFVWSGPLIELLATLPPDEVRPVFRSKWNDRALRDSLLPRLAERAQAADTSKFIDSIESSQADVARAALGALERLPAVANPDDLAPLIRLLRRTARDPKEAETTRRLVALIQRVSGPWLVVKNQRVDEAAVSWFESAYPGRSKMFNPGGVDLDAWAARFKTLDWSKGDVVRGSKLFRERGCQTCHDGPRALGPDLLGVTSRLTRADLFTAIIAPNLDVSPLYRTTMVETRQGLVYSGMIAFESADGLILQTGATTTVRVANDDIASREPGARSLMPEQLLNDLADKAVADLDAYLRSQSKPLK